MLPARRPLHPLTIGLALGASAGVFLLLQWLGAVR